MRVTSRDPHGRDRGAVAAIVCVIMVVAIGGAAFAVDSGNLWQTRRNLNTVSDAAALGAAQEFAFDRDGCATVDDELATANNPDAVVTECTDHPDGDAGYVTVSVQETVEFAFAKIFGMETSDVTSTTHVRYGYATAAQGLRPMGLCIEANPQFSAWLNLPDGPTADSAVIRVFYNKDHPDACGGEAPGNWGLLDFNGGSNSNAELKDWVANGYTGWVNVGEQVEGDPGAFGNSLDIDQLEGQTFTIPVFDEVSGTGANTQFHIISFVTVELVDVNDTGSQADRYMDLIFKPGILIGGRCCSSTGTDTGDRAQEICGVDPSAPSGCSP